MRVLIAGSCSPFSGREEIHWTTILTKTLRNKGIDVDSFMLPFVNNPLLIPEQMMSLRLLDVESGCDLLLTVGYPAFVLKHRHKRVLLFSLASSLHEHFGTEYGVLATPQYQHIRDAVHVAERKCLIEAERILCASKTLAAQIQIQYKLPAKALILDGPSDDADQANLSKEDTRVVCVSTLEPPDRIDLLLNAVIYAREQWQLMIFVPSASDVYRNALHQRIEGLGLKERVIVSDIVLFGGGLEKARAFVALNFAVTRIPAGLLDAIKSRIPVITATDCGAILEVTQNKINGLVVEPSAVEIAHAVDNLITDETLHKRLSHRRRQSIYGICDVDTLVETLVEQ